jgi:HEAT repeat protein
MAKDEPSQASPPQPLLFDLEESTAKIELFPSVWTASEGLTSPHSGVRRDALEQLLNLNAPRFSPLVAYLLASRLTDPEIAFRAMIVKTLGDVLSPDENGHPAPEKVRQTLSAYLAQMRTRHTFALLQALVEDPSLEKHVANLLNACPYAGNHLADILSDRRSPLSVRKQAGRMIGRVGFLDAIPALERLSSRLEARLNGQRSMPFAPASPQEELDLLPIIQTAMMLLRAP